ncbi:MAG: V-type ATP synthase subunit F [bacterium]
MENKEQTKITYLGPSGAGFGFRLAGIDIITCDSPNDLVSRLKEIKEEGESGIVLIDEGLAEDVLDDVEKMNQDALPAIVLVTQPGKSKHLAAHKMNRLLIKAVGSDILSH